MTQSAYPKVGGTTTDAQFREFVAAFAETGALKLTDYAPVGDSSGMNVKVAAGVAFVDGIVAKSTAQETVAIAAAPPTGQSRIDTVVLQLDYTKGPIVQLAVVQGVAAATGSQAQPSLTASGNVKFNWPICNVLVGPGAVTITSGNVTDRRTFIGTNVDSWTTRPTSPTRRVFGFNRTTGYWEGWTGTAWVTLSPRGSTLGEQLLNAASMAAAREALGIYVQEAQPSNPPVNALWAW